MRFKITIRATVKGSKKWVEWNNGGIGYSADELKKVEARLKADNRVTEWVIDTIK